MSQLPLTGPPLGRRRLRASIYVRLSNAADEANTSLENMIAECRAVCAAEDFAEAALHIDDGITGGVRDRPEFIAWLDDARHQRADVLVAHHVDRMTREGLNVAAMILDVQEGKDPATGRIIRPPVRLIDTKGLDSNNGVAFRILFLIKAETAREERERAKQRVAGRSLRLRLAGRWPGGTPPFGYEIVPSPDGKGKTLALCQKETDFVRECAGRILIGHKLGRTVRWLNRNGPKPRRAAEWSRATLKQVLTGDHILGRVVSNGVVQRDEKGRPVTPFPAVLDLPTVLALRKVLASDEEYVPRGRHPARLGSKIIECDGCGNYLTVAWRSGRPAPPGKPARRPRGDLITYRCQRRAEGRTCSQPVAVSALPFEAHLEEMYLREFGRSPLVEHKVMMPDDARLAEIEEELALCVARLAQSATPEGFAELQRLQAERDTLSAAPREPTIVKVLTGRTLAEEWHDQDIEGRREMLTDAYAVLRLGPGKRGRHGFDPGRLLVIPAEGEHDPDD
ncbi:recombinase family protein [Micromonospora sp. WMMD1082]|uniref:recombinase family protein n=1 Tax=Micromonospora sp. WMMD1082 TaxID=3016104 RepID=UPI002415EBA0|nr:recombinase family protein [Micromonospora sp. WMMD1082]MDG4792676.1 recombinase family protein [Micromonospora sp. WMMD1082]